MVPLHLTQVCPCLLGVVYEEAWLTEFASIKHVAPYNRNLHK